MEEEKVTPSYFQLIYDQLTTIEQQAPWADQVLDQIQLRKMDVRFLKTFCLCLETWDDTTDEESMFRLRSITTTFRVIWPKEHKGLSLLKRLAETWPIDIEDFHSANIELESRIQQSKLQFEGWCENLMHSSMQCKSPTFYDIWDSLQHLQKNLDDYSSYRVVEIVPYEKQIDFLKGKIVFLDELVDNVERCPYTKEILQFLSFVRAFANNAACIACLYWAKESNEEIATEMYIVLFDMLQKFIPYTSDITPLYIGILKSYDLQPSDCFRHGEPVESFVEFFFRHLAICLKYDFLILRDKLIFLITFLTDPPCENAEQEESIRSQIYALFHEDAYLLLPFEGIKTDFSKKMLLTDCMTKIDTANAKIDNFIADFQALG